MEDRKRSHQRGEGLTGVQQLTVPGWIGTDGVSGRLLPRCTMCPGIPGRSGRGRRAIRVVRCRRGARIGRGRRRLAGRTIDASGKCAYRRSKAAMGCPLLDLDAVLPTYDHAASAQSDLTWNVTGDNG